MKSLLPELICELPVFSASGLVILGEKLFIISDDELSLLSGEINGKLSFTKLWQHDLPEIPELRKKRKPDLESLYLDGRTLWALPSFSRPNRVKGAKIILDQNFNIHSHEEFDFSEMYQKLLLLVPDLNIEGAVLKEKTLHLFHRGNGSKGSNSIIEFQHDAIHVRPLVLPKYKNIQLTVTDATLVNGEIYFLAVAEDTESTYLDGEVIGSFLGKLGGELMQLDFQGKPEGLSLHADGNLYFVTDDDSRAIPSRLFRLKI